MSSTPLKRQRSASSDEHDPQKVAKREGNIEHVDLEDVEDDSDLTVVLKKQREEQIKNQLAESGEKAPGLSSLQCIICLEPPRNLTSTKCGHLFCHTCLMEALIAGETSQSRCPVCRTTIRREKKNGKGEVGWQSLELKVATRKKDKGKAVAT